MSCEAAGEKEPVRLEVEKILGDTSGVFPYTRSGDGSIVFDSPRAAEGTYTSMKVWAIAADGTTTWPFYVTIRNRYAPVALTPETQNAIRGVETVIPRSKLFSDTDVDNHAAESGDNLTSVVTGQPVQGAAWFDGAGNLHFRSIDVIHDNFTDHVTVKTTDSFGLESDELTVSFSVSDITPGCATGGVTTDAATPVRIRFVCWITPLAGWTQLQYLEYSIATPPQYGTLTEFDPVSGSALYTPDAEHLGPIPLSFSVDNNGATRTAAYTVNVVAAP